MDQQQDEATVSQPHVASALENAMADDNKETSGSSLTTSQPKPDYLMLYREAVHAQEAAELALRNSRKRQRDFVRKTNVDFGEDYRWFALVDTCVEKTESAYRYRICFFDEAYQGDTSLGKFAGWEDGSN